MGPKKVEWVEVYDPQVETPTGLKVGDPYSKLAAKGTPTCVMVQTGEDGVFFCRLSAKDSVSYAFPAGDLLNAPRAPAATASLVFVRVSATAAKTF